PRVAHASPRPPRRSPDLDCRMEQRELQGRSGQGHGEITAHGLDGPDAGDDGLGCLGIVEGVAAHQDARIEGAANYDRGAALGAGDRKSTRLNSSHVKSAY